MYGHVWTELFCQKPCSRGIVWSCGSLLEYRSGFLPRAAGRTRCQISLARSSAALQGPGQPSCSSHKPFHVPKPQAKSGASLLLQHQRMCLPNSWDMMTVASLPRVKKEGSNSLFHSVLCLLLISILNFLCLSCLSLSLRPPVPILVCVSLIITFWYWRFPEVTDHRFSCHMCFFFFFALFLHCLSRFLFLPYMWLRVWTFWQHQETSLISQSSKRNATSNVVNIVTDSGYCVVVFVQKMWWHKILKLHWTLYMHSFSRRFYTKPP